MLKVEFDLSGYYNFEGSSTEASNEIEYLIEEYIPDLERILDADLQKQGFISDIEENHLLDEGDWLYVHFLIKGSYTIEEELTEDTYWEQDNYIQSKIIEIENVMGTVVNDFDYVRNIVEI